MIRHDTVFQLRLDFLTQNYSFAVKKRDVRSYLRVKNTRYHIFYCSYLQKHNVVDFFSAVVARMSNSLGDLPDLPGILLLLVHRMNPEKHLLNAGGRTDNRTLLMTSTLNVKVIIDKIITHAPVFNLLQSNRAFSITAKQSDVI